MPTTPIDIIVLRTLDPLPLYGPAYETYNRPGLDGERRHYIGMRGERARVRAIISTDTYGNGETLRRVLAAAQGSEIYLIEILDEERRTRFFLDSAQAGQIRRVTSTRTNDNYRIDVVLELTAVEA